MLEVGAEQIREFLQSASSARGDIAAIRNSFERMSVSEQTGLMALIWIGKQKFDRKDLNGAIAYAEMEMDAQAADSLLASSTLIEDLLKGVEALGIELVKNS